MKTEQKVKFQLVIDICFKRHIIVIASINGGHSIIDIDCAAGNAVKDVFNKTIEILN